MRVGRTGVCGVEQTPVPLSSPHRECFVDCGYCYIWYDAVWRQPRLWSRFPIQIPAQTADGATDLIRRGNFSSWVLLALFGITSALLSLATPELKGWFSPYFIGTVYGAALVLYFAFCRGVYSLKGILLIASSAVAYPVAFFGSLWVTDRLRIPASVSQQGEAAPSLIFAGGVLGGLILLPAAILLYKPRSQSWAAALGRIVAGIPLSGIVGVLAWELGPTLGKLTWTLLPTAPYPQPESHQMDSLFMIWQPVMAIFIGFATSNVERDLPPEAERFAQQHPATGFGQQDQLPTRRTFIFVAAGLFAVALTRVIPIRTRLAKRERAAAKAKETKPPIEGLPELQPMNEQDALILAEIVGYRPGDARKTGEPISHEKGYERAPSLYYGATYTNAGAASQTAIAGPPGIDVIVEQYPTEQWAQYSAEYPPRMYNSFDDPKFHAIVMQMNNKVRSSQLERPPGATGIPLYYMWPSGTCVVTINYRTRDENLEFLKPYLLKYPSSIH